MLYFILLLKFQLVLLSYQQPMGLEEFIIRDTNDRCGVRTSAKALASMNRGSNARQLDTAETHTLLRNPHRNSTSIITPAIDSSVESVSSAAQCLWNIDCNRGANR